MVESFITQCITCKKHFNVRNKQECCGIVYLVSYTPPMRKEKKTEIVNGKRRRIKKPKAKTSRKKTHYTMDKELRESILQRDKYKCTQCSSAIGLQVHHLTYRENGGSEEPNNLITLCELCHAEMHRDEPVYNIMIKRIFKLESIS